MKYILKSEDEEVEVSGQSLRAIRAELCGMLSVDGYRSITVSESWPDHRPRGATISVSLYDDEDVTVTSSGRVMCGDRDLLTRIGWEAE